MEHLVRNQNPFRLLYNITGKFQPPSPARTARHAENRIGNLVFIAFRQKFERLDLAEAVSGCIFTSQLVFGSSVNKDITQLILDVTKFRETSEWMLGGTLQRQQLPLYIIMLFQPPSSSVTLIRETCGCDDGPAVMKLEEGLTHLNVGDHGMASLVKRIRAQKRNFCRRKLVIVLSRDFVGSWEEDWEKKVVDFTFTRAHTGSVEHAYAGILGLFHSTPNFTVDTLGIFEKNVMSQDGVIHMHSTFTCVNLERCSTPPLSLYYFLYFSTLNFSNPVQSGSFNLKSLAAPFLLDPMAAIVLIG